MAKKSSKKKGCLICGRVTVQMSRGLCSAHYRRFTRHKEVLEESAQAAFENDSIEAGLILASSRGRPSHYEDPFNAIAEKYRNSGKLAAESGKDYKTSKNRRTSKSATAKSSRNSDKTSPKRRVRKKTKRRKS